MYKLKLHYFVENYVVLKEKRFLPTRKKKIFYFCLRCQTHFNFSLKANQQCHKN